MICDEDRLLAFLFEELEEPDRAAFDDHLLGCESCWTAVTEDRRGRALAELLREPAPAGLAERIRLAAQAEGLPGSCAGGRRSRRSLRRPLAAASIGAAAALVAGLLVALLPGGPAPSMTATLDLVRLGAALPMHVQGVGRSPQMIGAPRTMSMDSVQLRLTWYGVDGGEALLAHSAQPFAMPTGGTPAAGGRAWTAQLDGISIYCACAGGGPAAAIVTPMQPRAAIDLAAFLDMPT